MSNKVTVNDSPFLVCFKSWNEKLIHNYYRSESNYTFTQLNSNSNNVLIISMFGKEFLTTAPEVVLLIKCRFVCYSPCSVA